MTVDIDLLIKQQAALKKGLRAAARIVVRRAKQLVPPPGYPGDKPEFKPLRDTITSAPRQGRGGFPYVVVGPARPAGAHGHLVEGAGPKGNIDVRHHSHGKPTGTILRKQSFLYAAAQETQEQQKAEIVAALRAPGYTMPPASVITVSYKV